MKAEKGTETENRMVQWDRHLTKAPVISAPELAGFKGRFEAGLERRDCAITVVVKMGPWCLPRG